ncbi:MAG: ATP-binding protein [Clostridia bacterium]|nr:ATP-binding protein [Clostridia bacterium]
MKGIYEKISAITEERKENRRRENERRRREVFAASPKIQEIEAELDRFGIRMLNLIANGECDSDKATSSIMAENKAFIKERDRLLCEAGFDKNYLDVPPYCTKCDDNGFIDGKLCSCLQNEITAIALREANLSENLAGHTFENFRLSYYSDEYVAEYGCSPRENMQAILSDCKAFVENFDRADENLLFCGSCGLGKTFLSSAIANELIKRGKDVLYVSSNALFPILEDMHFGRTVDESAQYIVNKIGSCELLILDDLGSEFVTQFTCAELFRIINTRLNSGRKMIISTNLNRNMLQNTYNERIASRITGGFSMLEFLGEDIRRIKKLEGKM